MLDAGGWSTLRAPVV